MPMSVRRPVPLVLLLPVLLLATAGCDIITAELRHQETSEWRRTYELQPGGSVEIRNVNGKIAVERSSGRTVEVMATLKARGATPEDAKRALERIEIVEDASPSSIRIETKVQRDSGWRGSNANVAYTVRVPDGGALTFRTVNGGLDLRDISGTITAETTNGGIDARDVAGSIDASTTNGGIDVEMRELNEGGAKLECTNGGISLALPADARANVSARVANGGIDVVGLQLETTESSRRRLEGRLNGGGPAVTIRGTNGGIELRGRSS